MSHNTMPGLPLSGGCQCGQLRYQVTAPPLTLYCCHCTECQGQSSSAFGMSLRVESQAVVLEGEERVFLRDGGRDTAVECVFCPDCGCRILHRGRGGGAEMSIKAGSLDDTSWLAPVGHIWMRSAQPWFTPNETDLTYEAQPEDGYAALVEAFRARYLN